MSSPSSNGTKEEQPSEDVGGGENEQNEEKQREAAAVDEERVMKELSTKDLQARLDWAEANHRSSHDTDIEWLHRKAFLAAHVGRYPMNRLLSLASCYTNSVVLGCRYPQGVMTELNRVEEDTIRAVEALLSTSDKQKHLRGARIGASRTSTQFETSGDEERPASSSSGPTSPATHQRPSWFNDLTKSAT